MEELIKDFVNYKSKVELRDEKTTKSYVERLKGLFSYYNISTKEEILNLKAKQIENWLAYLVEKKDNSINTRNLKLTAVKLFYKYLQKNKYDIDDSIFDIVHVRPPKKVIHYLKKSEFDHYIYHIGNLRTKAMVVVLLQTGMRFSEIQQLTVEDFEKGRGVIHGKGNKERIYILNNECTEPVLKYYNKKRKHIIERTGVKTNLLFISDYGGEVNKTNFNGSLKYYAKKAGFEWWQEMSAHKLRHSFITSKLQERETFIDENGNEQELGLKYDLKTISMAVGHSSIQVTDRYSHTEDDKIKEMMLGGNSDEKDRGYITLQ